MRTSAPTSASANDPAVLHPIPRSGERLSGLTRQNCYEYLRSGLLKGVKIGDRTLITDDSLRALPGKLPRYRPNGAKRMATLKRGIKASE